MGGCLAVAEGLHARHEQLHGLALACAAVTCGAVTCVALTCAAVHDAGAGQLAIFCQL